MQVKELQAVCLQMKSINKQIKELDDKKKDLNLELSTLKASVVEHLDKLEIKSFDFGEGKVTIVERRSVKMLDKFQFFEWLKTKGTFEDIVSVNAQTLKQRAHLRTLCLLTLRL